MRQAFIAALAATGLCLFASATPAQSLVVTPGTGQQYVQYYTPYTYGSNSFYYYPNTGYAYTYPYYGGTSAYSSNYVGPTVYGPGYTANYPYMYNQLNYGYTTPYSTYYYPGYTTYRTWRWR
jgi:hypothetical protein